MDNNLKGTKICIKDTLELLKLKEGYSFVLSRDIKVIGIHANFLRKGDKIEIVEIITNNDGNIELTDKVRFNITSDEGIHLKMEMSGGVFLNTFQDQINSDYIIREVSSNTKGGVDDIMGKLL